MFKDSAIILDEIRRSFLTKSATAAIFTSILDGHFSRQYRVFPGGKEQPGRDADLSPLLLPLASTPRTACTYPQCLYKCTPNSLVILYQLPSVSKSRISPKKF
jgi:hypothetical protein